MIGLNTSGSNPPINTSGSKSSLENKIRVVFQHKIKALKPLIKPTKHPKSTIHTNQ